MDQNEILDEKDYLIEEGENNLDLKTKKNFLYEIYDTDDEDENIPEDYTNTEMIPENYLIPGTISTTSSSMEIDKKLEWIISDLNHFTDKMTETYPEYTNLLLAAHTKYYNEILLHK